VGRSVSVAEPPGLPNDVFEKFAILALKFRNKKGKNQGKSEFFVIFL
jgi:hypothetical protein